jgi:hypothetical protein
MKRQMLSITFTTLLAVALTGFSHAQQQDGTAIVKRSDQKLRGDSRKAEVSMKIIRPSWSRTLRMKMWSLKNDYSLTLVTAPAKEQGKAFLKRENEIWNWVPDISRMIKLPPSMMSQSWMGSDFNNNDLIRESSIVTDYNHKLIGSKTIRDKECYKIKMIPKADAPVVWSKVITYITKENYIQLRAEYYGQNDELVDLMKFSNIREMDGRTIPTKLTMIPKRKDGHKTVMQYHSIDFGIDIQPRFFSKQSMKSLSH